jgi:hypothetical protein
LGSAAVKLVTLILKHILEAVLCISVLLSKQIVYMHLAASPLVFKSNLCH